LISEFSSNFTAASIKRRKSRLAKIVETTLRACRDANTH
jgi:hypothetical protein